MDLNSKGDGDKPGGVVEESVEAVLVEGEVRKGFMAAGNTKGEGAPKEAIVGESVGGYVAARPKDAIDEKVLKTSSPDVSLSHKSEADCVARKEIASLANFSSFSINARISSVDNFIDTSK